MPAGWFPLIMSHMCPLIMSHNTNFNQELSRIGNTIKLCRAETKRVLFTGSVLARSCSEINSDAKVSFFILYESYIFVSSKNSFQRWHFFFRRINKTVCQNIQQTIYPRHIVTCVAMGRQIIPKSATKNVCLNFSKRNATLVAFNVKNTVSKYVQFKKDL